MNVLHDMFPNFMIWAKKAMKIKTSGDQNASIFVIIF